VKIFLNLLFGHKHASSSKTLQTLGPHACVCANGRRKDFATGDFSKVSLGRGKVVKFGFCHSSQN